VPLRLLLASLSGKGVRRPMGTGNAVAESLKRLRERAGNPSLAEVTRVSGLARSTVERSLKGGLPQLANLRALVTALGGSDEDMDRMVALWRAERARRDEAAMVKGER
jgi:hypothetical protein